MAFYVNGVYLVGAALVAGIFAALGVTEVGHPSLDFLVRPWAMPGPRDLALMGLCGVIAAVAMSLLTHAYRLARANLVTVFEYTGMIWVPLWGFVFFMEVPTVSTVIGTLIIIAAGVFAVRTQPNG
jgi:drug/metabolite transporter (DMT)-like permease